jgi:hypothetical protein
MVMAGDNIYLPHESYSEPWSPWKVAGFVFDVVAIGNHNLSYDKEISYFQLPGEYYSKTTTTKSALWFSTPTIKAPVCNKRNGWIKNCKLQTNPLSFWSTIIPRTL